MKMGNKKEFLQKSGETLGELFDLVPLIMVETYEGGLHNGDLMNVTAVYNMWLNGIEIVAGVE